MRSGETRTEIARGLELLDGRRVVFLHLIEAAELVMRHRLGGHELHHLLELLDGFLGLVLFLIKDAEIEPGVRQLGIFLLHFQQFGHARFVLALAEQCQPVVQSVARRLRR